MGTLVEAHDLQRLELVIVSREDDEGEISDEAPMEFDESPELSEGESENKMNESDDCGGESDESCSSGDEYRSPGRGCVRAKGSWSL